MLKRMNATLLKALLALVPTLLLLAGAILVFLRERGTSALLQLLGAASLVLLGSAVVALTLFPIGYLFHALKNKVG